MSWLVDLLPWWLWLAVAAVVVFAIARYFGRDAAVIAAGAALIAVVAKMIRQGAKDDAKREARIDDLERANEIHTEASEVRAESDRRNDDPVELRNNDGWRRD